MRRPTSSAPGYADGESLDELLPEAFAVAREAAVRTIGQRHFPVQLMGGAALHLGNIAEMKTGEGKTLTSVLPAYLNAIAGDGVHLVTVNDYLAKRDAENMGRIHRFLGLSVGVILSEMPPAVRREQYAADITYGTNNEFGFDYLRDNMAWQKRRSRAARPQLRHRRRGRLDPHRRGPHPADHLRARPSRAPGGTRSSRGWRRCSSATSTTRSTSASAPWASPRRASRWSKTSWASTTSTRPRTPRSSAT